MEYTKDNPLKVVTLFSGYDSQCLALDRLCIDYDLVAWSDIDKYAIQAHNALFPQYAKRNIGDVSKADWNSIADKIDLLTYSSPCTDFSMAGKMAGGEEGSGTRSSLLWEVEKAIQILKPKYLVFENVAALVSKKFLTVFNKWQKRLEKYGYTNFVQIMNSKDYGCPQNRRRLFMVSVYNCNQEFHFPKPITLEKHVCDLLETNVDERYYLSDERIQQLLFNIVNCDSKAPIQVLGWTRDSKGKIVDYHAVSVANCVTANKRDNTQNYVLEQILLNNIKVRRLTERELFRIMDLEEKHIDTLLKTDIPKTQLAKLAGNSIVVGVLCNIFRKMFVETNTENEQLKLFIL